jgi:hypothetical protein
VVHDPLEQVRVWVEAGDPPAPLGAIEKLVRLKMRSNSSDPHFEHFISTGSPLVPMTRISIYSWHLVHLNSNIGIIDSSMNDHTAPSCSTIDGNLSMVTAAGKIAIAYLLLKISNCPDENRCGH